MSLISTRPVWASHVICQIRGQEEEETLQCYRHKSGGGGGGGGELTGLQPSLREVENAV